MTSTPFILKTRYGSDAGHYYQFDFHRISNFHRALAQGAHPFNYPDSPYTDAEMFRFQGPIHKITFTSELRVSSEDLSGGKAPDGPFAGNIVKELDDQVMYLLDYILNEDFRAIFYLAHDFWLKNAGATNQQEVVLEKLDIRGEAKEGRIPVTCEFTTAKNIVRTWSE